MRSVLGSRTVRSAAGGLAAMLVGGIGYFVVGGVPGGASAAPANPNNYNISAEADSVNIVVQNASVPLFPELSISPWGASSALDSVGTSTAAAGLPYSPQVFTLPGTVNGLGAGGLLPPIPTKLPVYVSSNYPANAKDVQTQGGVLLFSAISDENSSEGKVGVGVTPAGDDKPQVFADAKVTANSDGSVTATASAGADLLNLGGLANLGEISSTSTLTLQAGGKPKVTSSVKLGTITLLGNTLGLTNLGLQLPLLGGGLQLTDQLLPVLNTVLKPAGVSLTFLPTTYTYTDGTSSQDKVDESKTVQGVDSGGLSISMKQDVPGLGPATVSLEVGRTFLSATNTPGFVYTPQPLPSDTPPAAPVQESSSSEPAVVPPPAEPPSSEAPAVDVPVDTGPVDVPVSDAPVDVPVSDVPQQSQPIQQPVQQPAPRQVQQVASTPVDALRTTGAQGMFLIIFLAGIALLAGSQFVRLLAVKLAL